MVAALPLPRVEQVPMEELARLEVPAMALAMALGVLATALERLQVRVSVMALVAEARVAELVPPTRGTIIILSIPRNLTRTKHSSKKSCFR